MGLRCSVFGHDWAAPESEREREETDEEVLTRVREVRTCNRCGATDVLGETMEVTAREDVGAGEQVAADPEAPPAFDEERAADPERDDGVILDDERSAADDEGSAERGHGEWPEPPDVEEQPVEREYEGWPEPPGDAEDAAPDQGPRPADGTEPANADREAAGQESADAEPSGAAGQEPPGRAEATEQEPADSSPAERTGQEPADAESEEGTGQESIATDPDEGAEIIEATEDAGQHRVPDDEPVESEEIAERGADERRADERGVDERETDRREGDEREGDEREADEREMDGREADEREGDERGADRTPPAGTSDAAPARTEFYCPGCGFVDRSPNPSLRPGDICPECGRSYIAEREQ